LQLDGDLLQIKHECNINLVILYNPFPTFALAYPRTRTTLRLQGSGTCTRSKVFGLHIPKSTTKSLVLYNMRYRYRIILVIFHYSALYHHTLSPGLYSQSNRLRCLSVTVSASFQNFSRKI
jgi:hypothetical protein